MGLKEARVVMVALWIVVGILAILPLMNIKYFRNFYGRSGEEADQTTERNYFKT